jgi:LysM repeat protein
VLAHCVMLCSEYGLIEKNIIYHCEGRKLGIASNHVDVEHWFPRHGESMDTFRAAVKKALAGGSTDRKLTKPPVVPCETYTVQHDDTLWGIAQAKLGSGVRYVEIKALNNLATDTIHAGQVLKLPK